MLLVSFLWGKKQSKNAVMKKQIVNRMTIVSF